MFSNRNIMAFGTTLALTIIVGSIVQGPIHRALQGRLQAQLKSVSNDIGDQYSPNNLVSQQNEGARKGYMAATWSAPVDLQNVRQNYQNKPYYNAGAGGTQFIGRGETTNAAGYNSNSLLLNTQQEFWGAPAAAPVDAAKKETLDEQRDYPQRPAYSIPYPQAPAPDRKVIKNSNITLKVQDAQAAQMDLQGLVGKYNGNITYFTINKIEDGSRRGVVVFNVLSSDFDAVLQELRQLGEVQAEVQTGSDVTNQYEYLRARIKNYKAADDRLHKVLKKNANNVDNNLNIEAEISNIEANIGALDNSLKQLDAQSFMSTIVVTFFDSGKNTVKQDNFQERISNSFKEHFKSTIEAAYTLGINSFSGIVIVLSFLLQILIWGGIFWGIYLVVRRLFKK